MPKHLNLYLLPTVFVLVLLHFLN